MGQTGGVVFATRSNEDLGLVLETPEGVGVEDAISISLVIGAKPRRWLGPLTPAGVGAFCRPGRQVLRLKQFDPEPDGIVLRAGIVHDRV